jgi:hypothetical protein
VITIYVDLIGRLTTRLFIKEMYALTGAESLRLIARHFVDFPSLPVNVTAFNGFEL